MPPETPSGPRQTIVDTLSTLLKVAILLIGIGGILYSTQIYLIWGFSIYEGGLWVNHVFYDWPAALATKVAYMFGPILCVYALLYAVVALRGKRRNLAHSVIILTALALFVAMGPFNVVQKYYDSIPRNHVPPSLQTFETNLKSGAYTTQAVAYQSCLQISARIPDEATQLDDAFTDSCLYAIALHFDDPLMCQNTAEYPLGTFSCLSAAYRNEHSQTCDANDTYWKTHPGSFDSRCLTIYAATKNAEAKCSAIPDYKNQPGSEKYIIDGLYPREFCLKWSSRTDLTRRFVGI